MKVLFLIYSMLFIILVLPGLSGGDLRTGICLLLWIISLLRTIWLRVKLERQRRKADILNRRLHHCIKLLHDQ